MTPWPVSINVFIIGKIIYIMVKGEDNSDQFWKYNALYKLEGRSLPQGSWVCITGCVLLHETIIYMD